MLYSLKMLVSTQEALQEKLDFIQAAMLVFVV
jgi:hypothetical protein